MTMIPINQVSTFKDNDHSVNRLSDKLIHHCGPLLDQLGIRAFIFRSFEAGGNGCFYSSDLRFDSLTLDTHLANSRSFIEETKNLSVDKMSFVVWSEAVHATEPYYKFFKDTGVWGGLTVYRRRNSHLEVYMFAGLDPIIDSANFFLNNYDFLIRFIHFFLMKIENAPIHTARFRFAFKDRLADIFSNDNCDQNQCPLASVCQSERILLTTPTGDILLSQRESACLRLLSSGKTAKEIARVLELSHRTIESYINNIRQKTGLRTRSELVDAFHKSSPFVSGF